MIIKIHNLTRAYEQFPEYRSAHIQGMTAKLLMFVTLNNTYYVTDTYAEMLQLAKTEHTTEPKMLLINKHGQTHVASLQEWPTHVPTEKPLSELPDDKTLRCRPENGVGKTIPLYRQTKNQLANLITTMVNLTAKTPYLWPETTEAYMRYTVGFAYANPIAFLIHSSSNGEQNLYTLQSDNIYEIEKHQKRLKNCIVCVPADHGEPQMLTYEKNTWLTTSDKKSHTTTYTDDITVTITKLQRPPYRLMAMPFA